MINFSQPHSLKRCNTWPIKGSRTYDSQHESTLYPNKHLIRRRVITPPPNVDIPRFFRIATTDVGILSIWFRHPRLYMIPQANRPARSITAAGWPSVPARSPTFQVRPSTSALQVLAVPSYRVARRAAIEEKRTCDLSKSGSIFEWLVEMKLCLSVVFSILQHQNTGSSPDTSRHGVVQALIHACSLDIGQANPEKCHRGTGNTTSPCCWCRAW